jgi:hypothetical protein
MKRGELYQNTSGALFLILDINLDAVIANVCVFRVMISEITEFPLWYFRDLVRQKEFIKIAEL